jgi:branched-chain amino acid transport system permease protein
MPEPPPGVPGVTDLLQLLVAGFSIGSIYAMTAIGFVLLWQTSNTINFAQGEFVVLPAFAMVLFWMILKLPFAVAFLATVFVSTLLLGFGVRKLLVARLLQAGVLPLVIATIGLSLLIRYSLQQFWTPLALPFPALFPRVPMQLGTVLLSWEEIMNVVFAGAVIAALQLFITRTKLGWAMQAVAQNRTLATVLGIDVGRLVTITFVLNAALTAVAAILIAPVYLVKYDIGIGLGLKAFYAAIIGGFNQMRGALLGGLLVGIVETLSAAYISGQFRDAAVLAILVAVLLWKPEGLWGVKEEWAS